MEIQATVRRRFKDSGRQKFTVGGDYDNFRLEFCKFPLDLLGTQRVRLIDA